MTKHEFKLQRITSFFIFSMIQLSTPYMAYTKQNLLASTLVLVTQQTENS